MLVVGIEKNIWFSSESLRLPHWALLWRTTSLESKIQWNNLGSFLGKERTQKIMTPPCPQKSIQLVFCQYLLKIFTKFQKEGQFWNLLILRISKLTLIFNFGQVEAEIFKLLDTRGHFHFSHEFDRFIQFQQL